MMQINTSQPTQLTSGLKSSSGDSFSGAAAAGITPVGISGGTQLEQVAMLAKGWREAIAGADQGMRGLQVR